MLRDALRTCPLCIKDLSFPGRNTNQHGQSISGLNQTDNDPTNSSMTNHDSENCDISRD